MFSMLFKSVKEELPERGRPVLFFSAERGYMASLQLQERLVTYVNVEDSVWDEDCDPKDEHSKLLFGADVIDKNSNSVFWTYADNAFEDLEAVLNETV